MKIHDCAVLCFDVAVCCHCYWPFHFRMIVTNAGRNLTGNVDETESWYLGHPRRTQWLLETFGGGCGNIPIKLIEILMTMKYTKIQVCKEAGKCKKSGI